MMLEIEELFQEENRREKKSKFKINLRKEQLRDSKVEEMTAMVI